MYERAVQNTSTNILLINHFSSVSFLRRVSAECLLLFRLMSVEPWCDLMMMMMMMTLRIIIIFPLRFFFFFLLEF